jgi:hypothetical protein
MLGILFDGFHLFDEGESQTSQMRHDRLHAYPTYATPFEMDAFDQIAPPLNCSLVELAPLAVKENVVASTAIRSRRCRLKPPHVIIGISDLAPASGARPARFLHRHNQASASLSESINHPFLPLCVSIPKIIV